MRWGETNPMWVQFDKDHPGSEVGECSIDLSPVLKSVGPDDVDEIVNILRRHRSHFTDALAGEILRMSSQGLFEIPTEERRSVVFTIRFSYSPLPVSRAGYVLTQTEDDVVRHVHWVLSLIPELRYFDVKVNSKGVSRSTLGAIPEAVSPIKNLPIVGQKDSIASSNPLQTQ